MTRGELKTAKSEGVVLVAEQALRRLEPRQVRASASAS